MRLAGDSVTATNERNAVIEVRSGGAGPFQVLGIDAVGNGTLRNDGRLIAAGAEGRGIELSARSSDTRFDVIKSSCWAPLPSG